MKTAALRLQEHKHPVRFRNVWAVENGSAERGVRSAE